jgi:hypothetical protein
VLWDIVKYTTWLFTTDTRSSFGILFYALWCDRSEIFVRVYHWFCSSRILSPQELPNPCSCASSFSFAAESASVLRSSPVDSFCQWIQFELNGEIRPCCLVLVSNLYASIACCLLRFSRVLCRRISFPFTLLGFYFYSEHQSALPLQISFAACFLRGSGYQWASVVVARRFRADFPAGVCHARFLI